MQGDDCLKKYAKALCVLIAMLLVFAAVTPAFAAEKDSITITNPYDGVDWTGFGQYKTALHTHTNASDGDPTMKESLERHAETGFDIVASTDHGTVNYSWEYPNEDKFIHGVLKTVGKSEGELEYPGKEGTFKNGISYTLSADKNGDDFLTLNNGKRIMRVPYGIEQNAVSVNAHVNSWFADYHNNFITTYEDAVKGVEKTGGVCVINHPGEYSKARYEIRTESAYNEGTFEYKYFINKIASLLSKYNTCIGIDINSKGDDRTRFDRKLWDILLQRFADNGENVFAICSSDAHQLDKIDTGFVYAIMENFDSASLKKSLQSGHFFGASHCIGNPDELGQIAEALKEFYGETELYSGVKSVYDEMLKIAGEIEDGTRDADSRLGVTYKVLDDDGYCTAETQPVIESISVNDSENTIRIESTDALIVRWISNGKLIASQKADSAEIDLDDYSGKLGNYIRAEVFGEGGIVYTQAFLLNAEINSGKSSPVDAGFFDLGIIDFLLGVFMNWREILSRMI